MNILFITTHLNTGGITSYLLTLSKGLIINNVNVHIASSGGQQEEDFLKIGANLHYLNIRTKSEISPKLYFALPAILKIITENNIDILHAQTRIAQVMSSIVSHWKNISYISTCHGFFKTDRISRRIAPCWGELTVAISPAVKTHLIKDFSLKEKNVFLVRNGIDINQFPLLSESDKKKGREHFKIQHEPVIGIIARLSDVKGHAVLIKAMPSILKVFPEAGLSIVGEGKEEANLRSLVNEYNLEDQVTFYPIVNKTAEILPLFDVFVMPSLNEGLGLSILEAQAAGLPVVASAVGGIPNIIKDGDTGYLVEPNNCEQLAQAVIEVLQNQERNKSLGRNARDFIQKEYSQEMMVEETINVYNLILKTKK